MINRLLKENEFLRKIIFDSEIEAQKDYSELINKILINTDSQINNENFNEKIDLLLLNNKRNLKRQKSKESIKNIKSVNTEYNHINEINETHGNNNYFYNELIRDIQGDDNDEINLNNKSIEEIDLLKNIGNIADINKINCNFFDKKLISKSSRNIGSQNKIISPKANYNDSNIINKNTYLYSKVISKSNHDLLNNPIEAMNKTKSRNDNNKNKLEENPNIFNNNHINFDDEIQNENLLNNEFDKEKTDKTVNLNFIKIEDQEEDLNKMNVTVIENKIYNEIIEEVDSNNNSEEENYLCEINTDEKRNYIQYNENNKEREDEKIYPFKYEFANKLNNIPKSHKKDILNVLVNKSEDISKVYNNEKTQKKLFHLSNNLDNFCFTKMEKNDKEEKTENYTFEKNESTNSSTDINNNYKQNKSTINKKEISENYEIPNNSIYFSFDNKDNEKLNLIDNNNVNKINEPKIFLREKIINENLIPINNMISNSTSSLGKNFEDNSDKNITFGVDKNYETGFLFSNTPRDLNNKKY